MNILSVQMKNCYGIKSLDCKFDFKPCKDGRLARANAIYAPNGSMKTSFAKAFKDIANDCIPKELRFNRNPEYSITVDGKPIDKDCIWVQESKNSVFDSEVVSSILINLENKKRYDGLIKDLNQQEKKLVAVLQKFTKVKRDEVKTTILDLIGNANFSDCVGNLLNREIPDGLKPFPYSVIFSKTVIALLESDKFSTKAREFLKRYEELFTKAGPLYKKGVFNPTKAEISLDTLQKNNFFQAGHRVHIMGEIESLSESKFKAKLEEFNKAINSDESLGKLHKDLARNIEAKDFTDLLEKLSILEVEFLLLKTRNENRDEFEKDLWAYYIQTSDEARVYYELYLKNRDAIVAIERDSAVQGPIWVSVIKLFNERFIDMPFTLSIKNIVNANLGKETAVLEFTFLDGEQKSFSHDEVLDKGLSEGEKRALSLLYFIFKVESRKLNHKKTLFIIDDIADSFDYKNKIAILQYLIDLQNIDYFYQIILTHNFDFFRSLRNSFVPYNKCFMINKNSNSIILEKAEAINNYFVKRIKVELERKQSKQSLCASIPYTRNLIEYLQGNDNEGYLKLTSLLHWKKDTSTITINDYISIYKSIFKTDFTWKSSDSLYELLLEEADRICKKSTFEGLNLEDKIILSMVIRIKAEKYIIEKISTLKGEEDYSFKDSFQFRRMLEELKALAPYIEELSVLNRVSITVNSNIHLNSFMYESIIDLGLEHLIQLHNDIDKLRIIED